MPTHIKEILNKFADIEPKIAKSVKDEAVINLWYSAVDKRILKQTEPVVVKDNILFVLTSSSAWANELSLLRKKFVEKINKLSRGSALKDIRFKVGPISQMPAREDEKAAEETVCRTCGATHRWNGAECPVCRIYKSGKKNKMIFREINETRVATFDEVKKKIPDLKRDEFFKAAVQSRAIILDKIRLVGREAEKKSGAEQVRKLKKESERYINIYIAAFGGDRDALLKKTLSAKAYKILRPGAKQDRKEK